METSLSESVQQLVRPGKCVDLYYPDPETSHKQCFRTTVNNRYVQQFASLSGGSSVFTVPPNNMVQDIILVMELPAQNAPSIVYNGAAIPEAWGYSLIKQVSFRYGGSSQFFLSGQQLLQNAMRKAPNSTHKDALFSLGGNATAAAAAGAGGFAQAQRAYVWLSLPHCVPSSEGKIPGIPSDLLTQQLQFTVELNPLSSIFSIAAGATPTLPTQLSFGEFQCQQVILADQSDALARRVDMTSHALTYPLADFTQQEIIIPLQDNAASQSVTLTGFRSGEVRNIQAWITVDADTTGNIKNPFKWYAMDDVEATYAGEIYARYDKGSSALWNLVNGRQPSSQDEALVADAGGGACSVTTPFLARWVEIPFAQPYNSDTAHSMYTAGLPITNGILNLKFSLPQELAPTVNMKLHISYNYNGVLTFSQGSCDYVI
jgi:hypothetical protein